MHYKGQKNYFENYTGDNVEFLESTECKYQVKDRSNFKEVDDSTHTLINPSTCNEFNLLCAKALIAKYVTHINLLRLVLLS